MIAIDSPGLILKKLKTAPAPVWIPHPKGARTERSYAASTFTSVFSSATTALEKDDWPKQCEITSAPGAALYADLPSSRQPLPFTAMGPDESCVGKEFIRTCNTALAQDPEKKTQQKRRQ